MLRRRDRKIDRGRTDFSGNLRASLFNDDPIEWTYFFSPRSVSVEITFKRRRKEVEVKGKSVQ
jgi:hypothetical protein